MSLCRRRQAAGKSWLLLQASLSQQAHQVAAPCQKRSPVGMVKQTRWRRAGGGGEAWGEGCTFCDALAAHEDEGQHDGLKTLPLQQRPPRILQPLHAQRRRHPTAEHVELWRRPLPCAPTPQHARLQFEGLTRYMLRLGDWPLTSSSA